MKAKVNARQRREAESLRRKGAVRKETVPAELPSTAPEKPVPVFVPPRVPDVSPEEETREFLEYLDKYDGPMNKDDTVRLSAKKGGPVGRLNLEEGMPLVEEALDRMNIGLQEMRVSRAKVVKLIHGYGSTGRGGKICSGVRQELASMKRKGFIREFIPGEHFGPLDAASRKLAEQEKGITRDPDYGRMNHGITVVVL